MDFREKIQAELKKVGNKILKYQIIRDYLEGLLAENDEPEESGDETGDPLVPLSLSMPPSSPLPPLKLPTAKKPKKSKKRKEEAGRVDKKKSSKKEVKQKPNKSSRKSSADVIMRVLQNHPKQYMDIKEIAQEAIRMKLTEVKELSLYNMLSAKLKKFRTNPPSWFQAKQEGNRWKYRHR